MIVKDEQIYSQHQELSLTEGQSLAKYDVS